MLEHESTERMRVEEELEKLREEHEHLVKEHDHVQTELIEAKAAQPLRSRKISAITEGEESSDDGRFL